MNINEFQFTIPTKIIYKSLAGNELIASLKNEKIERVLIVTDSGIAQAGFVDSVEDVLTNAAINFKVFKDVEANPSIETVYKGTEIFKQFEFQALIGLGGGSPIDTAKAIAIQVMNSGNLSDYEGIDSFKNNPLPVFAIPTTAGTGSEVTPFSVITDKSKKYKLTIISSRIIPKVAIIDPCFISKLPAKVAASTGMDALTHAIESYVSLFASPYSEAFAEKAIRIISENLRLFVANRQNEEAAGQMMVASLFAGLAFTHSRLGNAHAMAHPLSGYFNIPHGVANAILLPHIMEYNLIANPKKFSLIAKMLKKKPKPQEAVEAVKQLNDDFGIPMNLSYFGVKESLIPEMAKDAMKSGNVLANPRQTGVSEIEALYKKAMN